MSDSELPRFEVFVQERSNGPHLHAGSVHASDGELALLNARDVFARRPECHSLWIVPADRVVARTEEQLRTDPFPGEPASSEAELYLLFGKIGHKGTHTYLASVLAVSPAQALQHGLAAFEPQGVTSWWLVPERFRRTNQPEEAGPWFDPALDKPFRDQAFYPVETFMRNLRRARARKDASG